MPLTYNISGPEETYKPFINSQSISIVRFTDIKGKCSLSISTNSGRHGTIHREGDCQTICNMYKNIKQCLENRNPICYMPPELK